MTLTDHEATMLKVLAGQSDGYLLSPAAAAVQAAGLTPQAATLALEGLAEAELAQEEEVVAMQPVADPETGEPTDVLEEILVDGKPVTLDGGWTITEKGRKQAAK